MMAPRKLKDGKDIKMVQRAKNCNEEELANALGDAISSSIPEVPINSKMNARVASETSDDQESCGSLESSLDSSISTQIVAQEDVPAGGSTQTNRHEQSNKQDHASIVDTRISSQNRIPQSPNTSQNLLEVAALVLEMAERVLEEAELVLEMAELVLEVAALVLEMAERVLKVALILMRVS
ncbi:hypothetical protein pipiens_008337 [Culex pipiens pipiens]|uniref:Uncharacterized protein n=1 Tax=Culex pipiens pipiens TaxID=38569 RepID=A0ABD1DHY8_CULPP